jgi:uncharacterized protein (DUF427 family)
MSTSTNSGPGYAKNPSHVIIVAPFRGHVVVEAGGEVLADTRHALELKEGTYPPVLYVPRSDVRMERLTKTTHSTHCPFKGDASYHSIVGGAENAIWSYETPFDEVLSIKDHMAFYPNRVDAIRVEAET